MANTTISPNMNLVVPTVSVDPGPDWANNVNASLSIIDQHNHAPGSGAPINQDGIALTPISPTQDSLSFNSSNAVSLRSVRFSSQGTPLALLTDVGCLYESGVDLYFNDGSGNQIRITQGGSVAGSTGTITGLPSGTASASFSAATFIFQSATNTAANIDGGSYILRNSTAGSHGLTLSPPNAMSADYSITLPSLPAAAGFVTMDTSGNLSASSAPLALNQQVSSSCGDFSTASSSYVDVTNLSVSITTNGRPVFVGLMADGSPGGTGVFRVQTTPGGTGIQNIDIVRGSTVIAETQVLGTTDVEVPVGSFWIIDSVSAGTYSYKVQTYVSGTLAKVTNAKLIAYEL